MVALGHVFALIGIVMCFVDLLLPSAYSGFWIVVISSIVEFFIPVDDETLQNEMESTSIWSIPEDAPIRKLIGSN